MQLLLKNIGMIKEANVKIDGLTVIAGENDTGKSTVGKLLFSLIKASSRYKEDLEENKEEQLFSIIEKIYFRLRKQVNFSDRLDFRKLFYPPKFQRDIDSEGISAIQERLDMWNNLDEYDSLRLHDIREIENNLYKLIEILSSDDNIEDIQRRAFKKVLISEFKGKIANQNTLDEKTKIKVYEGNNPIVNIMILNNNIKKFEVYDELYFNDATFIESPILLQLSELIDNSKTYFEDIGKIGIRRPNVALHIKDLNQKLKESEYNQDFLDFEFFDDLNIEELTRDLSQIINGNIKYNKKTKDFIYVSNGKSYYNLNTATGIKSFGIMQMLIQSGFINERSLLILDEPEVHLHTKWQLKYADFIVKLVENNINVLVTSHSPYMIEALKRYSDKKNLQDKSNFYLASNNIIEDKNKLQEIYEKLSEPFDEFDKMDSDILNGK